MWLSDCKVRWLEREIMAVKKTTKVDEELKVAAFANRNAERVFLENEKLRLKAERTDKYMKWLKNICLSFMVFEIVMICMWFLMLNIYAF